MNDWPPEDVVPDWWAELDDAVLRCLAESGAMAPDDIARRLGLSADAVASILWMLAQERRVRIRLVECDPATSGRGGLRAA